MYYSIIGLCPRTDLDMINLHPKWKGLVTAGGLTQEKVNHAIKTLGNSWLDACGYDRLGAGENCEGRLYEARSCIRISWGEWGPEHISVPGNACGLDLDNHAFGNPLRGPSLLPHNIDHWGQVQLLLIAFTFFAETLTIQAWEKIKSGEV